VFVAKAEAAKPQALQQTPSARLYICTNAQWRILMAIIARLSDKKLSYNSVEMTQKSCFLMVSEPGFGPGSGASLWIWSRLTAVNRDHFETASH